ncbi:pyridine nucleotide-disulfide oxidoreductase [Glaciecola punicea]|uniref:FAD-dependent oxidoreductase n=1 Tax=Glaciecola punicea TaxID=56804 RepID=UPI000871D531|nr:FAD-dependent oxidoreductase [Glaciecola punicea]OFA32752.1 pyridine nucleotide-disulfide oxidoreductase [Glaciecola punicea]
MKPTRHSLILAGAGHAHLVAMRRWIENGYNPPQGTILLSPSPKAWYSGMMPGLIAGRFTSDECAIDLAPLCKACEVELVIGEIADLNAAKRRMKLTNEQVLEYDYLSLNVGSVPPQPLHNDGSINLAPAKPFAGFNEHWQAWRKRNEFMQLAVLGGGAAAFELALALQKSLPQAQLSLICSGDLLSGYSRGLRHKAIKILDERGIKRHKNTRIDSIANGWLISGTRQILQAEALVIATGAAAQPWLASSGLKCDNSGFVEVSDSLQSLSHPEVLASGDCANQTGAAHSGVYAVRQGSALSQIIPALLDSDTLREYKPQARALALLATADGGALMHYGRFSAGGRLLGMYKDYLDKGFMGRHTID